MEPLDKYILDHSSDEEIVFQELDRETNLRVLKPRMISGHIQGKFLELVVKMVRPKQILEIGTFTGYSALSFARGLDEGGVIDTIEIDDELESISSKYFDKASWGDKITQHIGSALDIVPTLGKCYDLVFIDGDKREYTKYYEMLFQYGAVKSGSWIIADNVIWYGKVLSPVVKKDLFTENLQLFNKMVKEDPRVENIILPLRDGLNIVRVL